MDNSLSKALIMVAGVLLAMLVMAFVTFSFHRIGEWAAVDDNEILTEQVDKFNKEYEAYDKNLMYGVDVISCLNKAKSNNDAIDRIYAENVDTIYEVKVKVKLTSSKPLEESIEVYHVSYNNATKKYMETKYSTSDAGPKNTKIDDAKFEFITKNTKYYTDVSNFKAVDNLKTEIKKCKVGTDITEFNLTKDKNSAGEAEIRALLSISSSMSETVKNTGTNANQEDGWSKASFQSALYNLKTRKFKCTDIKYNAQTGRINYIEFTEIS